MNEPVEYQYRTRPDWITEWNGWNTCSKESAEAYEKTPYLHDWHYEVRRLYITPPQRTWVGLMRGVRVEGDTVVISVKGGNDAARELCGALIEEMNR